jgi:hypothetical protein
MKTFAILGLCLLACACQNTSFQGPPLDGDAGCDPALAGHWASVNDEGVRDDEMHLAIGGDCSLTVTDREGNRLREGPATTLSVAHLGEVRYAWVPADWADLRFEAAEEYRAPAGDIYLFRYRVTGDELAVDFVDHKAVAHRLIDGGMQGSVRSGDRALINRVVEPTGPELLAIPDLFDAEARRFRREAGSR